LRFVEHVEGDTWLLVPEESIVRVPPPTSPIFFNPEGSLNRDITISITMATSGETFCDSMCGVGARGIRVAKEVERPFNVTLVDFNEAALALAKQSATLNKVEQRCEFSSSETSVFLHSRFGRDNRFDFVDVDPFGTPTRQIQGALSATSDGGIISLTATDTATLCGVYPEVSKRRYGSASLNNRFHHETGVRILFSALAREAAKLDAGIKPIAAHSTKHYIRVYARVEEGASEAEESLGALGFVVWCPACGDCAESLDFQAACRVCGRQVKGAGPLWLGRLTDPKVVEAARAAAMEKGFTGAAKILESLSGVDGFPPWSFSIEETCSRLKVASIPAGAVHLALESAGHTAMKTPFEKWGVKTDASYAEFADAVKTSLGSSLVPGPTLRKSV
jgi:tRNA (guanine26-N2/guanine27-N2)-dimethyltransferase